MATLNAHEIVCAACGKRSLVRPEPIYSGFKKVGESYVCLACGHRYESAETTPFVERESNRHSIFGDSDHEKIPNIFKPDERRHSCAWCANWVKNPFSQRCSITDLPTEATDDCAEFTAKKS